MVCRGTVEPLALSKHLAVRPRMIASVTRPIGAVWDRREVDLRVAEWDSPPSAITPLFGGRAVLPGRQTRGVLPGPGDQLLPRRDRWRSSTTKPALTP